MDNNYKAVATKISEASYERLSHLCHKLGMDKYEILQGCVDVILRYTDDRHNLTPDMERIMSVFEHMQGWKDAFHLCDASAQPVVVKAVYFIQDEREDKHGIIPVMIEKPYFGHWNETENVQDIFEQSVCLMFPELYRRLRATAVEIGTQSVIETLLALLDEHVKEEDLKALREPFEDNDRGDFGQKPDRTKYKHHPKRDIESPEFGFRPIGYEE